MSNLILDADFIAFAAASAFQTTYILAKHPAILGAIKLSNKTALWGSHAHKDGGFIAEHNALHFTDLKPSDFTYTDHQEPMSVELAKRSVDLRIQALLSITEADKYSGFVGRGQVFRVELSTLLRYKGTRVDKPRPIHLTALKQHLVDKHNCTWVEKIESDDAVSIAGLAAYQRWKDSGKDCDKGIMVFEDKDLTQVEGWQYHVGQTEAPELRVGLGKIWRDDKGKVKGWGRLHLYWQLMRTEKSDNFSASCFSDVKFGDVSAYNLLSECKSDKQALTALLAGFNLLYPEPKKVVGWRGRDAEGNLLGNSKDHEIEIDAIYVMNECFNLAKMLRTYGESPTDVRQLLNKLGITQ